MHVLVFGIFNATYFPAPSTLLQSALKDSADEGKQEKGKGEISENLRFKWQPFVSPDILPPRMRRGRSVPFDDEPNYTKLVSQEQVV